MSPTIIPYTPSTIRSPALNQRPSLEESLSHDLSARAPQLVRLSDIAPQPVDWLWPGRIAIGKLTLLVGDPGAGKSFLACDLAARISTGAPWPDTPQPELAEGDASQPQPQQPRSPGSVILLSAEDDWADTIRPRLDAHGADVTRIVALQGMRERYDPHAALRLVDLSRDRTALERAIDSASDCRLVVVDPVSAYLGRTNSHSNANVRAVLEPLAELANRKRVALLAITHLRKSEGPALYRALGSLAFIAAARSGWAIVRDSTNPERRLMLPIKNNLANDSLGLAYRITPATDQRAAYVSWEAEPVNTPVDEALSRRVGKRGPIPTAVDDAANWLAFELSAGERAASDLYRLAKNEAIGEKTLRAGFAKLGGEKRKEGLNAGWVWSLPS